MAALACLKMDSGSGLTLCIALSIYNDRLCRPSGIREFGLCLLSRGCVTLRCKKMGKQTVVISLELVSSRWP